MYFQLPVLNPPLHSFFNSVKSTSNQVMNMKYVSEEDVYGGTESSLLIDWMEFYDVSAIFPSWIGGIGHYQGAFVFHKHILFKGLIENIYLNAKTILSEVTTVGPILWISITLHNETITYFDDCNIVMTLSSRCMSLCCTHSGLSHICILPQVNYR